MASSVVSVSCSLVLVASAVSNHWLPHTGQIDLSTSKHITVKTNPYTLIDCTVYRTKEQAGGTISGTENVHAILT